MKYTSLKLPPGMNQNGTTFDSPGRYVDGDRVRWQDGLLRPIGGWRDLPTMAGTPVQIIPDPLTQVSRALLLWTANDGTKRFVAGHNGGLSAYNFGLETVNDITPAGFTPQPAGALENTGYGGFFYGTDAYGTQRPSDPGLILTVFNWVLRPYGEQMVASPRLAPSSLYLWDGLTANVATVVANAPTDFTAMNVTTERSVMVGGSTTEQRLIQWSDVENLTDWTPAVTNQAGSFILAGVGRIEEIVSVRGVNLIITENDAYTATYVGPPYIYSFAQVGTECGVVSGAAVVVTKDFAVWPGRRNFYIFDGTVRGLPSDVIDGVSANTSLSRAKKGVGYVNPVWSEVWWLLPSTESEEPDTYVFWNYRDNHWGVGTLDRSIGGGPALLGGPLMIDYDGNLLEHEIQGIVPGAAASDAFVVTAPLAVNDGDRMTMVSQILPDFIEDGSVDITLFGMDIPGGPELTYGPYRVAYSANPGAAATPPTATRARGRQISMKIEGASSLWKLGNLRLNVMPGGQK